MRPVRGAYRADLAFVDVTVEPLHDRFDWRSGVVAMKQIQINEIGVQRPKRRVEIVRHISRREPRMPGAIGMTSLTDNHNLVAVPAFPDPGPQCPFAVPIYARRVERVAPQLE